MRLQFSDFNKFFIFCKKIEFVNWLELSEKFLNISITIGIGSLAMVLTALSIIASMFSEKFSNIVNQANAYFDFTVPFLLSALIWICVVLLSLFGIILIHINDTKILIIYIISFTSGFLVSGFKSIIDLIITSIKLGYYKNKIVNK